MSQIFFASSINVQCHFKEIPMSVVNMIFRKRNRPCASLLFLFLSNHILLFSCLPGSYGEICENSPSKCANADPCQNNATCSDVDGQVNCTCLPGMELKTFFFLFSSKRRFCINPSGLSMLISRLYVTLDPTF